MDPSFNNNFEFNASYPTWSSVTDVTVTDSDGVDFSQLGHGADFSELGGDANFPTLEFPSSVLAVWNESLGTLSLTLVNTSCTCSCSFLTSSVTTSSFGT
jgi:hypothetical protein